MQPSTHMLLKLLLLQPVKNIFNADKKNHSTQQWTQTKNNCCQKDRKAVAAENHCSWNQDIRSSNFVSFQKAKCTSSETQKKFPNH
jgi:hypothetical protein